MYHYLSIRNNAYYEYNIHNNFMMISFVNSNCLLKYKSNIAIILYWIYILCYMISIVDFSIIQYSKNKRKTYSLIKSIVYNLV